MQKRIKTIAKQLWPYLLPFFAGILLVFAFAPFQYTILSFISPAILLFSLKNTSLKQAFFKAFLFGLGLFGVGASWIYVSIYEYGGKSIMISGFITALFVLALALFPGFTGLFLNKFFPQPNYRRTLFAFPMLWVVFEIFRGWFLTGFPWLYLGYTQIHTHLKAYASVGSVWLVSWIVIFNSGILYEIFNFFASIKRDNKKFSLIICMALLLWLGGFLLKDQRWTHTTGELEVALIQGNIEQNLRWDQNAIDDILRTYQTLTQENIDADLIIWPESAIPVALPYSQSFVQQMHQFAKENKIGFITGIPIQVPNQEVYYNALISLGQGSGEYHKQHLVPFGEYVPFESVLRGLVQFFDLPMSSFISGAPPQKPMVAKGYQVAPAICYEIAYPFTIRKLALGSHMIVTVSNDTWFGDSFGPKQHLEIAQFRALETGRYVLRATNTGWTAIIQPNGSLKSSIEQFKTGVLRDTFYTIMGETPWMRYGPWILGGLLLLSGLIAAIPNRKRKRK